MNLVRVLISWYCLATLTLTCHGQKFRDISKLKTRFLKYETSQYEYDHKIPFKKIEVVDFRFDTSKIGYFTHNNRENHTKFVTPGGLQNFLTNRLNHYFKNNLDPSSSQTLFIVVKKLWLEYESTSIMLKFRSGDEEPTLGFPSSGSTSNRNTVCLADIDAYCNTDTTYQALIRLAYNFIIDKTPDYSDGDLLLMPFDSLVAKIQSMDVSGSLASRRKFSRNEIFTNYRKRFDLPALMADSLNRGIFLSFNDFRNNKPVYPDFKFRTAEFSTEVTIEQGGKEVSIIDYWGFSDGKELYVKPGYAPFRVLRQGNTFDFLGYIGSKNIKIYRPTGGAIDLITPSYHIYIFPMQVDMETGKVY